MSPHSPSWRFPRARANTSPTNIAGETCEARSTRFQRNIMDEARKKTNQAVTPGPALTRREWLMSLGSAVVLSGFRGVPEEAVQEAHAFRVPLPQGLYRPSLDHLADALESDGAFVS